MIRNTGPCPMSMSSGEVGNLMGDEAYREPVIQTDTRRVHTPFVGGNPSESEPVLQTDTRRVHTPFVGGNPSESEPVLQTDTRRVHTPFVGGNPSESKGIVLFPDCLRFVAMVVSYSTYQ